MNSSCIHGCRERERETERQRDRETETERETERQRQRERDRERETERGGEREKERERETERGERDLCLCAKSIKCKIYYDLHTLSRSICVFAPHHGSYDLEYCIVR